MDANQVKTVVLVVDDDENVLRSIVRHLNKLDSCRVFSASTRAGAEEVLATEKVELLVCDYNLGSGVPNGVELITKWRKAHPCITRAVILSGSEMSEIPNRKEVDSILSKSSNLAEVVQKLLPHHAQ